MLKDANGSLVNSTHANQKIPECTQGPNKDTCHWYGFQTQCGRDAWVKFAVDTGPCGMLRCCLGRPPLLLPLLLPVAGTTAGWWMAQAGTRQPLAGTTAGWWMAEAGT